MKQSSELLKNVSTKTVQEFNFIRKTSFQLLSHAPSGTAEYENAGGSPVLNYAEPIFHDLTIDQTVKRESATSTPTSVESCHSDNTKSGPNKPPILYESTQNEVINNGGSHQDKIKVLEKEEIVHIPQTHFIIGLLVLCCFNLPFGLVAIYFSLRAAAAYRDGNNVKGVWHARVSIVLSLIGIMLTMMAVGSIVVYIAVNKHNGRKTTKRLSSSALGF